MTRDAFLRALRAGLAGLPAPEIDDLVADYAAHFAESAASGRQEAEVAASLGDPERIARELRAELGLRRLEAHWSASNLLAAAMALAGLAFVDLLFLLPLLVLAAGVAVALAGALLAIGVAAGKILFTTLLIHPGGPLALVAGRLFLGLGLLSAMLGGGALLLLGLGAGVRLLGRYARLHFRLLRREDGGEGH